MAKGGRSNSSLTERSNRGDVTPWHSLLESEQKTFEEAFQDDTARFARSNATFQRTEGGEFNVACLLASLCETQKNTQGVRTLLDSYKPYKDRPTEVQEVLRSISELLSKFKDQERQTLAKIDQFVRLWVQWGQWDHLSWLVTYGLEHAPDGISPVGTDAIAPKFPPRSEVLTPSPNGTQFKEVVLGEFLKLSGMPPAALHVATGEDRSWRTLADFNRVQNLPPPRMLADFLPVGLPTKARLKQEVEERWRAITGKVIDVERRFTESLGLLGLSGLPHADRTWLQ